MATSKKLTVINTASPPSKNEGLFSYWGNQAGVAQNQGWYPAVPNEKEGYTVYRSTYDAPFNTVYDPKTNQKARISVVGKRGNKMDIVIEGKDGNIVHTIHQNVSPEFVQDYMQNNQSTIQQRMNNVASKKLASLAYNKKSLF